MDNISDKQRIKSLVDALIQAARGDYGVQVDVSEQLDDIDSIAMGFNMMIDDLKESTANLEQINYELEKRVEERTHSLEHANKKLKEDLLIRTKIEQERQKLENQLRQSQKMEAVGQLAGGVAHDMNNILGVIMSAASLLEDKLKSEDTHRDDVSDILTACRNGRDLTQNLLGFARKGKYVKTRFSLVDLVEETEKLLSRTISKKIAIKTLMKKDLQAVEGDFNQLSQALMNICINANEAMNGTGTLTISTENAKKDELRRFDTIPMGLDEYVQLQVTDTGAGMDEAVLERVFEPFFTTKRRGQGTGLGLSMVYGTVRNHQGMINIESKPGIGTTVTIFLPARGSWEPIVTKRRNEETISRLGEGMILLVDDEPMVRRTGERLLKRLGYQVVLAENGQKALDVYRKNQNDISLIILDLIMPVMDGTETLEALMELNPTVKVIISSGYSRDESIESLLAHNTVAFLQKPFDLEQLSRTVVRTMDEGGAPFTSIDTPY